MFKKISPLIFLILLAGCASPMVPVSAENNEGKNKSCVTASKWVNPLNQEKLSGKHIITQAVEAGIVLLGETHTNPDHHYWQLHTIAALHNQQPNMVLGFEAFPRRTQPILDSWVSGKLSEEEFLSKTDWDNVWRYDSRLYMPLFNFARIHKIPMVALNVSRQLVRQTGIAGWSAIPEGKREGISTPIAASEALLGRLRPIFEYHKSESTFSTFVDSMLVWDRAMAEALFTARNDKGKPLVVGIVGSGHSQYGDNISRQLADLGQKNTSVLLPWDADQDCAELIDEEGRAIAGAVFGLPENLTITGPKGPTLGVMIVDGDQGVRVEKIVAGSLAESSGIVAGDIITSAAGVPVTRTSELIPIIKRQPPGTWLPLTLIRDKKKMDLVIKFPPLFKGSQT